jgi:4-hydroxy-2-oxoheptanedioate aldolase
MSNFPSGIVDSSGKTRFRAALDRAQQGGAPCVGQWLEFPGFTLAKTVAGLGSDVCILFLANAGNPSCTSCLPNF